MIMSAALLVSAAAAHGPASVSAAGASDSGQCSTRAVARHSGRIGEADKAGKAGKADEADQAGRMDIYLCIGQSNMAGRGELGAEYADTLDNVWLLDAGGKMEPACNPALHHENMEAFDYVLSLDKAGAPAVWAAWGTIIEKRDYLPACVRDMVRIGTARNAVWYSAGKRSKKGHPHHPLYLRKDSVLEPFDVAGYLDHL